MVTIITVYLNVLHVLDKKFFCRYIYSILNLVMKLVCLPNGVPKSDSVSNYDSIIKSSSITAGDGGDSFVQFVIVAVVIFVTLVATLLVITMYIRKVQKRRHTMW